MKKSLNLTGSLKENTVKGLKWSSTSQFSRQILQYFATIILVGILSPDDFGIIAMALIVINFLDIFKDLGTTSALIQSQNISEELKSSVFWINSFFGILITMIVYISSSWISQLLNSDEVAAVLQVLSLTFVIAGLSITQKALLEKSLSFKTLAIIELFSSATGFIMAIILALSGFGVWSIVAQSITVSLLNTMLIWTFSKWKPSFYFNFNEVKSIISYSLNLIGFNIVNYIARNSDYFLIGKFLGDKSLGHYYMAYRIMLYPLQNITVVISRVIFPSFSNLQNEDSRLRRAYLNLTNSIGFLTFPLMAGMAIVSHEFTSVFFGTRWETDLITSLIIILAPVGAIQSIISTVGIIYQTKGKTDWMFKWSIFATILVVTGFGIGLRWGIIGISISYLITNIIMLYPAYAIPFKLIKLNTQKFFQSFIYTLFSVSIMTITLLVISQFIGDSLSPLEKLIVIISIGILVYVTISYLINRDQLSAIKKLLPIFN